MREKFYIISWEDKDGNTHLHREEFMKEAFAYSPLNDIPCSTEVYKVEKCKYNR